MAEEAASVNTDLEFLPLLEELVDVVSSSTDQQVVHSLYETVAKICPLFRAARAITTYYENQSAEMRGDGEVREAYNNGRSSEICVSQRAVTGGGMIVVGEVFLEQGAAPWSDLERRRICMIQNIIFSFVSRHRLQRIADRLTFYDTDGYPNFRFFSRHISMHTRDGSLTGCSVIHFNLRHFKLVNQKFSRRIGDKIMRGYFTQFEELLDEDGLVCRIGGDNFIAITPGDKLQSILRLLRGSSVVYDDLTGEKIRISASAGIYMIPDDFTYSDSGDIMDKVVPASMIARTGGGDRIVYYDRKMDRNRERFMQIQQQFGHALAHTEFRVFYQPKVSVYTGELVGAEALCRWFRDGEFIPPIRFIPALEQNTDICRLDFYVLGQVCRDLRRWMENGRRLVPVSVNLSRKHLLDDELKGHLVEIIDEQRIPHHFIEFELTETLTETSFSELRRSVISLKEAGFGIAIDDFGVGLSSLNTIQELPWDVLKVDKSFLPIEGDDSLSRRSIMFRHVVGMARELGLVCVAEGVETARQVEILRDNNCDIAQGFHFDRPLQRDEFEKRLQQHYYFSL